MKVFSPQLGFNNNVRHKGRVFHIQTEDSGVKHPHVITHLFADGGRILKSTKTSYAEFIEDEELPKKVRALMQEQHKAMFIALRAGKFDHMLGDAPVEQPPASTDEASRPPAPSLVNAADFVRDQAAQPAASTARDTIPQGADSAPGAPPPSRPRAVTAPAAPIALARDRLSETGPQPARPPADTAVDADAGPISPKARLTPPPVRQTQPPPPPPSSPGSSPGTSARRTQPPPASAFRNMMSRASSPDLGRPLAAPRAPNLAPPPAPQAPPPPAPQAPPPPAPSALSPSRPKPPPPAQGGADARSPEAPRPPEAARAPEAPRAAEPAKPGAVPGRHRPPLSAGLDLDLQALELAAEQTNAPVYQQVRDLPPPPAAVFKGSLPEATAYRAVTSPSKPPPPRKPVVEERKLTPSASRYAPSRPASIFGNAKPQEGSSIFGEDLISEKSLDEVILSYLAEDLEPGPGKK